MKPNRIRAMIKLAIVVLVMGIILFAQSTGNLTAAAVTHHFQNFFLEMMLILPMMFILIGIIDVWVPREKVAPHIGQASGLKGSFWIILLAMLQAGPLYGAFPVAALLWKKGASIRNIFIYLGAFSTLKIPLLTFEVSFLGWKFSLLRTLITLPVFFAIAIILAALLRNSEFTVKEVKY